MINHIDRSLLEADKAIQMVEEGGSKEQSLLHLRNAVVAATTAFRNGVLMFADDQYFMDLLVATRRWQQAAFLLGEKGQAAAGEAAASVLK